MVKIQILVNLFFGKKYHVIVFGNCENIFFYELPFSREIKAKIISTLKK